MNVARLPGWLRQDIPGPLSLENDRRIVDSGVHTVCVEAECPNKPECFAAGRVTFLILGPLCSRGCRFCAVEKSKRLEGKVDDGEPQRVARAAKELGISYAVITSVTRDDLADGGALQFVRTIGALREAVPGIRVEVLIPDFQANKDSLRMIVSAAPEVIAHNLETIDRLYPLLRPEASYRRSLALLRELKDLAPLIVTKSSLMLGLSEKEDEVSKAIEDLKRSGCDILTLGQYLAPSRSHYPVAEFVTPEKFGRYRSIALEKGFKTVLSGPLVRSSYMAQEIYRENAHV